MKSILLVVAAALAACHHGDANTAATTPAAGATMPTATTANDDSAVDPTMPSWAPRSCVRYHRVTVQLTGCTGMPQDERDSVTKEYESQHAGWQALENAQEAQITEIGQRCEQRVAEIKDKASAASCPL